MALRRPRFLRVALLTLLITGCAITNIRQLHTGHLRGMGFIEVKISEPDLAEFKARGYDPFLVSRFVATNAAGQRVSGYVVSRDRTLDHEEFDIVFDR